MNARDKLSRGHKQWFDGVALVTLVPTLVVTIDYYDLWPGFRAAAFILTLLVVSVELCFRKIEGRKATNRTISNHLPSGLTHHRVGNEKIEKTAVAQTLTMNSQTVP